MVGNEDKARLFSAVSRDRTRGNRHKLRDMLFHLRTRKHFFLPWGWPDAGIAHTERCWRFQLGCGRVFLPVFQRRSIHCQPSVHTYRNLKLTSENQDSKSLSSAQLAALDRRGLQDKDAVPQLLKGSPVTMGRDQARRAACLHWATAQPFLPECLSDLQLHGCRHGSQGKASHPKALCWLLPQYRPAEDLNTGAGASFLQKLQQKLVVLQPTLQTVTENTLGHCHCPLTRLTRAPL